MMIASRQGCQAAPVSERRAMGVIAPSTNGRPLSIACEVRPHAEIGSPRRVASIRLVI
jgi:hypothetical protein